MYPMESMGTDAQLLSYAVRELARRTRFPVAFGGLLDGNSVAVTAIIGNRTRSLEGLRVQPQRGLGGRAMTELRPRMTHDYGSSQLITHDYDGFVLGEGLRTLLAIPVIVGGRSRGVLYAGAWAETPVGDLSTAPAVQVAELLASEIRVREEVERRMRTLPSPDTAPPALSPVQREELRESYAELRSISAALKDARLRERLASLENRLLSLSGDTESVTTQPMTTIHLSPREIDVLACAALGLTNAEIAAELSLREGTVKAYLGTAMTKLGASTRHAAVAGARRRGLLP